MGDVIHSPAARAGVSFEVERVEREGDELVVSGHWSGLRGVRFVRPTLVIGDRHVLATLEHKPWAPRADRAWIAAFPWTGTTPDAAELELAVAPSVSVALGRPADDPEPALALVAEAADERAPPPVTAAAVAAVPEPAPLPAAPDPATSNDRMRARLLEHELEQTIRERDELRLALDEAQRLAGDAGSDRAELEANLRRERRTADAAGESRDELLRARTAAERDRDSALAQLDEAVQDREAAVRTRTRMELACEQAAASQAAAEAALERANAQREEAQSQRDEVLLAYRALQRHVHSERAGVDRAENDDAPVSADLDAPLGVRTMPAARTIMAELQRPAPSSKFVVSKYDVWVVRVFGSVAAGCFILLLISIMRVFI